MDFVTVLWTKFTDLTWWQMILWLAYAIYFICRAYAYWVETSGDKKFWKGYKHVMFGRYEKYFRVYHIIVIIFDVPPAIVGLFFPVLRQVLTFKIYEFKKEI